MKWKTCIAIIALFFLTCACASQHTATHSSAINPSIDSSSGIYQKARYAVDRFLQTKRGQIDSIVNSILKREKISDYQKRRIMRNASLRRLRNITYNDIKLFTALIKKVVSFLLRNCIALCEHLR